MPHWQEERKIHTSIEITKMPAQRCAAAPCFCRPAPVSMAASTIAEDAEKQEQALLEEWASRPDAEAEAAAAAATREGQFQEAVDILDRLLALASKYHQRM